MTTTPIDIVQLCSLSPLLTDELSKRFLVHPWFSLSTSEQDGFLQKHASAIRAVVTGGHVGIPNALLARLPAVGIVAVNGVGLDKVDLSEAKRRGVRVTRTSGVLTDDVADLAIGLIISLMRGIPGCDQFSRTGQWLKGEYPLARKVTGRRFGIIGLGNIGAAIAKRLRAFGPVSYYNTRRKDANFEYIDSPLELARRCDVLVLAASANASTRGMVNRELLDALGHQGYLINVARGALVDEAELIAALQEKRIAGAALDVFADEPRVPEALRNAPNVVLTPHVASATVETREAMARSVLASLDAYFAGGPLPDAAV